ncbi:MAG: bifunctional diaminohydroxyphosphoribosylaminopyrimidine deaminase/5-amino-6-(5-phosphoribosylamino)uracil reductase RibD [Acidobacteriota bacterium]|nr:bifunctional diaminohydroxyphosphoribosylaminopyrimidine deaminase/5-amino-6-(5-phosphoribosylamino)uracil reductase RibD [Acidobacteriota bacterium]MDQ7086820.1 bifunctional diaminohydroxyphosphoribosylaminopyrimidine deaminase/5-amino-6-(5-phosphoribosylamino)uracil reductase RibD [Acidobacteriota bacterium]
MRKSDRSWLERAVELALRAGRATAPNPRVGAVLVAGDRVVGEGWHQRAGEAHAEALALARAGEAARGATAYVSLEPCAHHGRTPACVEALVAAGVRRVVVGAVDPDPRVRGRGIEELRRAGIEVSLARDTMADRARQAVEEYLVHREQSRSYVVLKVAASLDGRIADRRGDSRWITGPEAREHGRRLRCRYGAILVGVGTIAADDPRLLPPDGPQAGAFVRCVIDPTLRLDPACRLLAPADRWSPVIVYASDRAPAGRRRALESAGATVVPLGAEAEVLPVLEILRDLGRREVLGVIVEGGGRTAAAFLAAGLVDKIHWYLAPKLLVDAGARPAAHGGERRLGQAWQGRVAQTLPLGDDVLLTVYPRRSE